MVRYFLWMVLLIGVLPAFGQLGLEVRKRNGQKDIHGISHIDSIRFDVEGRQMELVMREGGARLYGLGEIVEVGFKNFKDFLYPSGTVHCDPTNPTEVVGILNPTTGKTWMDRNLGASRVSTSSIDAAAYGDLYQWGRRADGHQCRTSSTTTQLSSNDYPAHGYFILGSNVPLDWRIPLNNNLWQGINGVNNPCPRGYRLPTETELILELFSWNNNNAAGAFGSPLKFPLAGNRLNSNGSLGSVGAIGFYWSSTVDGGFSRRLSFGSGYANLGNYHRAHGFSVRCIRETMWGQILALDCLGATVQGEIIEGLELDGARVTVNYSGGNGGPYGSQSNVSLGVLGLTASLASGNFKEGSGSVVLEVSGTALGSGLAVFFVELGSQSCEIEIEVGEVEDSIYPPGTVHCDPDNPTEVVDVLNPVTGKTWMDRNLGASQVATSSTDDQAYGDLYQWGRRADGHQCRNSQTTEELSSTDVPGHGDFIITTSSPWDWRIPQNDNLWQGVNGVNNPCPVGYRVPTDNELNAERLSWSSNNAAGAFASPLKLPLAGYRNAAGLLLNAGTLGYCWSSTVSGTNSRSLYFLNNIAQMSVNHRALVYSIRCIKD